MSVSSKVEILLNSSEKPSFTVNEIAKSLIDQGLIQSDNDIKKIRHTVYQKVLRLVKQGVLESAGTENREAVYKRTNDKSGEQPKENLVETLHKRKYQLESRVKEHIAEAKGYDDLRSILPNKHKMLDELKAAAKDKCLSLNGQLASIEVVLKRLETEKYA